MVGRVRGDRERHVREGTVTMMAGLPDHAGLWLDRDGGSAVRFDTTIGPLLFDTATGGMSDPSDGMVAARAPWTPARMVPVRDMGGHRTPGGDGFWTDDHTDTLWVAHGDALWRVRGGNRWMVSRWEGKALPEGWFRPVRPTPSAPAGRQPASVASLTDVELAGAITAVSARLATMLSTPRVGDGAGLAGAAARLGRLAREAEGRARPA